MSRRRWFGLCASVVVLGGCVGIASPSSAQQTQSVQAIPDICPLNPDRCVEEAQAAVTSAQVTAESQTSAANGPIGVAGSKAESGYSGAYACTYIGTDTVGGALGEYRESSSAQCARTENDTTYYVGSPGSYGTVPYYGVSNGHTLRVRENSLRVGQYACGDLWVNSKAGNRFSDTYYGICGVQSGGLVFKGGYDRVGSSWCNGHPGGSTGEPNENIRGRCRYTFVRQ